MRVTTWMAAVAMAAGLAGCSYAYRNPAEALGPGEVGGRTVAGVEVLIDGVAVSVQGAALDATSRKNGRFTMLPLPVGKHTLMFRKGKERALQRDVEIAYGADGQPQGLWLGDVQVPAAVSISGECAAADGASLSQNGIAVDEVSGAIVPINGGSTGDFLFEGLSVGTHRIRVYVNGQDGTPYVGGPAEVMLLPSDAGTQKSMTRFSLHRASTAPADTGLVKLRFSVAGSSAGLRLGDLRVTGLEGVVGFASDGTAQVDLREGVYTVGIELPASVTNVTPPPRKTFVAIQGKTLDLGTLYAVTDSAQDQAALSCRSDADCAPGTCTASHVCTGYTPPAQAPASVPYCGVVAAGCTPGLPVGATLPHTATCAATADPALRVGVPCGGCCTPDGIDTLCGDPGVGGCPGPVPPLVLSPTSGASDTNCHLGSVTFTASGGTPPYAWTRDVGGLYVDPTTTTARWDACDYTIAVGAYTLTVTDSGQPPQSRTASLAIPDTTNPWILSVLPTFSAVNVPVGTTIEATFNEPLRASSVNAAAVTVTAGNVAVAGTVTLDTAGTTITFTPAAPLPAGAAVTVELGMGISDLVGNLAFLYYPYTWSFTTAAAPAADSWAAMSTTGAPSASGGVGVWAGNQLIVWGGTVGGLPADTGSRYDPATDSWTPMSRTLAPVGRMSPSVVWTGAHLIVWGGYLGGTSMTNTGGRYDPVTDTWTPTSTAGAPTPRYGALAAWTGTQLLVWGGATSGTFTTNEGARYDPATDTWTPMTTVGAPPARFNGQSIWTGTELIVWGGDSGNGYLNSGARYNPATDTWTATAMTGAPVPIAQFSVIWTGTEMIVWGGENAAYVPLGTGSRYNPGTDAWSAVSTTGAPTPRRTHSAAWTGTEMIVWGGWDGSGVVGTGGRYDPVANAWSATATTAAAPAARQGQATAWTGAQMLIWGGWDQAANLLVSGGRYTP